MEKCRELSRLLLAGYHEKVKGTRLPSVVVSSPDYGQGEGFELRYSSRTLHIKAESSLAEVFALGLIQTIVPAGHWHEFLGLTSPRGYLRPLWVKKAPSSEEEAHRICRRTAELGYNGLAWSGGKFHATARAYGLKAIAVEDFSAEGVDYLFCTGKYLPENANQTTVDAALKHLREVEASLPKDIRLIYYVPWSELLPPKQVSNLMLAVCRECRPATYVAFSVVAGNPIHDHLEPHPFWETLRTVPLIEGVGLLPLFNAGGVDQGEGLWPSVAFDLVGLLQRGCRRHSFAGGIAVTSSVPPAGGFLDANLWMASRALWGEQHPRLLMETWLKAYKRELPTHVSLRILKDVRSVVLGLSALRFDVQGQQLRDWGERLVLLLREIEATLHEVESRRSAKMDYASVCDYLSFFLRDAKRMLKLHLPTIPLDDDGQEGVWIRKIAGLTSEPRSFSFEYPDRTQASPRLLRILNENSFIDLK